jgi:hypothetical protein
LSESGAAAIAVTLRGIVWSVRLFLVLWLAVFAVQATELLTVVAPDGCTENASTSAGDACRDGCLRCICCARVPVFVTQGSTSAAAPGIAVTEAIVRARAVADPTPRAIYHVPKASLA